MSKCPRRERRERLALLVAVLEIVEISKSLNQLNAFSNKILKMCVLFTLYLSHKHTIFTFSDANIQKILNSTNKIKILFSSDEEFSNFFLNDCA